MICDATPRGRCGPGARPLRKRIRDERELNTQSICAVSGCITFVHVCICRIDAAISDAAKPIGWWVWVRGSYYLDVGRPTSPPQCATIQHKHRAGAPGAQTCHQGPQQRNQNCRFSQIQRNWSRNQNSRLTPESRESGQKSELPVYCLPGCEVGITLTNLSSKSPHGFFSSIQEVCVLLVGWAAGLSNVKL